MSELSLFHRDGKDYVEWTPEIAEQWRIGKAACEAKDWRDAETTVKTKLSGIPEVFLSSTDKGIILNAVCDAYAAGLAAAKPTGWTVEIASVQERPLSPEMLWKCELYNHDTSILSWSIPHTSKAGLKQYLKPLIDFLHATVEVVPMEKKGDEQ